MITATMSETRSETSARRDALRAGLEATRSRFHELLDALSEEQWRRKSPATDWSAGEVFVHLIWALEYLPKEVARAKQGKGMFNFPKAVADPLSFWYIRWIARRATSESVARRYNAAMDAALRALDAVEEKDWEKGANFYAEGFHTVADLFRVPAEHLEEHTAGM